MLSFSIFTVPLIIGYLLDLIFGDPRKLPHPIVAFGNIIRWCERHFNKGGHKKRNGCLKIGSASPLTDDVRGEVML